MFNRHKRTFVLIFIIFLLIFSWSEWHTRGTGNSAGQQAVMTSSHDDVNVALRAQLGYLKRKFAEGGRGVPNVNDASSPVIYAVTPTYYRPVQMAELTRLCNTFLLVPNFHWILVEDSKAKTELVTRFLANCGVAYTHLNAQTPPEDKMSDAQLESNKRHVRPRGVLQRNEGLFWLREHARLNGGAVDGVIYFADDDNSYNVKIFEEMRHTRKVSVWPVALVGGLMIEKPKVEKGSVIGWDVAWGPKRPFALDMAGFAVNYNHFLSRTKAKFAYQVKVGHQETEFLRHLVKDLSELEPKAEMCTKVYVYHTRTSRPDLSLETKRKTLLLSPSHLGFDI